MRAPLSTLMLLLSCTAYSVTLPVVTTENCNTALPEKLLRCEERSAQVELSPAQTGIPLETTITTKINKYCSTQYPIYLNIKKDDVVVSHISLFRVTTETINQDGASLLEVSVSAPWADYAYFSSKCSITVDIKKDIVSESL